jgi:hypothetical protein
MMGTQVDYQMMNWSVAKAKEEQRKSPMTFWANRGDFASRKRKRIIILKKVARFQVVTLPCNQ